ncbi:MAG: hypothetical protein KAJ75_08790 [Alphaproteobacteria bacterium]|nr:hypothetical protein [Alphaproteobacteria bacterium]
MLTTKHGTYILTNNNITREAVGVFSDKQKLENAIKALQEAGFEHSDLSILSSHETIDSLNPESETQNFLMSLFARTKYEMPLVASGLIAMTAGPTGAVIAALVAAGVGGIAVKRILDEITSTPDSDDFVRALEAGSLILWIAVKDLLKEGKAKKLLEKHGATNIHIHKSS